MYVEVIGYVFIFISGLFIGSFLNLVSDRLPKGDTIFKGRSKCDFCGRILGVKDLFPVLSFISLKGKCRYCDKKLSYYYPLSEILTGLAFVGVAFYFQVFTATTVWSWLNFAYLAILASFYIIIFLADLKYRIIPNKVVYSAIVFVVLFILASFTYIYVVTYKQMAADAFGQYLLKSGYFTLQLVTGLKAIGITLLSAIGISLFFWFLTFITKGRGMGAGDIKLGFLIGMVNGFPLNIVAIFVGFLTGAVFSIIMVLLRKKKMKDTIPFGPFLTLGSLLAFLFGTQILNWYMSFLG